MKKTYILKIIPAALFFLAILALYTGNMAPSFNSDDSPETSVAFHTLGVQHPPGYPLNTMIGKIFTFIPLGSTAFRANLMSAFFSLLAGFMIYLLAFSTAKKHFKLEENGEAQAAALIAAVFYMLGASAWLQGSFAKGSIYALNSFLLAVCLWALFRAGDGKKFLYLFSFIYGISMGNHWTSMAVIAPAALFYLFMKRKSLTLKSLMTAAAFFIFGCGVYLYVWIRSAGMPAYAWGDIKTVNDFIWLISRAQYSGIENAHKLSHTAGLLMFYLKNLFYSEYPLFFALLLIPGAYILIKKDFAQGAAITGAFLLVAVSVASFATPPAKTEWIIKPYMVSTYVFAALFVSAFFSWAAGFIGKKARVYALAGALAVLTAAMAFFNNPGYSRYFIGYDFAENISKTLPENSIVFTEGDMNVGAVLYKTLVDKEKFTPLIPVVLLYDWYLGQVKRNYPGSVNLPEKGSSPGAYILSIIQANPGRLFYYSNVYNAGFINPSMLTPNGLLYKIQGPAERRVVSDTPIAVYSFRGLTGKRVKYDEFTQRLVLDNYAMAFFTLGDSMRMANYFGVASAFYERGLLFAENSGAYTNVGLCYYYMKNMAKAEEKWEKASQLAPDDPTILTNLAFVYAARNDRAKAREYAEKALRINPANPTAAQIIKNLK